MKHSLAKKLLSGALVFLLMASLLPGLAASAGSSEKITVSIATMGTLFDSWMEEQLEARYNVDIKLIGLPGWSELNAKVNLLMADEGERPDVIWWSGLEKEYRQWMDAGLLYDLTEYFKKYPNIREYYSVGTMFHAANADGTIFRIPGDVSQPCAATTLLRKDWLDKLGLEAPTTLAEYRDALYAFTYKDPDGNGADDTIGFTGAALEWRSFSPFLYPFKADPNNFMVGEDGKIVHGSVQPQMKEALAYLSAAYADGLIDPNMLSSLDLGETFAKGKWGSMYRWIEYLNPNGSDPIAFKAANPEGEIIGSAPMKHPETGFSSDDPENPAGWCYFAITTKAKDPERIYAMFDDMASRENYAFKRYGQEGVHYQFADGAFKTLVTPEENTAKNIGLNMLDWMVNRKDDALLSNTPEMNALFAQAIATSQPIRDLRVSFKVTARPVWTLKSAEITKMRDEIFYGIISGQRPIDDFDLYVEQFYALGGEEIHQEANEYYATQQAEYAAYLAALK